jgi:putative ABC transport system ATP-binding protein
MILISDLHFNYPNSEFRLTVPEFAIASGEKIAVVGPSGSGKTTLLNLLAGILTPSHGKVRVGAFDVSDLGDAGRRDFRISNIGFVFQDFELLDYLSILDNILHPYRITGALKLTSDIRQRAIHLAEQMGIAEHLKKHPGELSQGEKQRAAICRALLPNPSLILADEATGNLDPTNKNRILDLLFESVAAHDATLVAVTHDHELLPRFDRVVDFSECQQGAGGSEQGVRSEESGAKSTPSPTPDPQHPAPVPNLQATRSKLQTPSSPLPAGEAL